MSQQAALTQDTERRFGALPRLYGNAGALRIRSAHVVVIGLGGVGSWAAETAARSGVARLSLIDLDHVAESNVNRQIHALTSTLGQAKVLAMRDRIALINADCKVHCVEEFVDANNWPALIQGGHGTALFSQPLAVLDACDDVRAKTAIAAWALANPWVHFVSVGAAGGKRLAHLVAMDDLAAVTHDPLLGRMRNNLRKHHAAPGAGKSMGVVCVFSKEPVLKPSIASELTVSCELQPAQDDPTNGHKTDHSLNCHGYGSTVSVTATFGCAAMGWLINEVATAFPAK